MHQHHHKSKPKAGGSAIAHAEAALSAGVPYESPHEGHQHMFSSMQELEQSHESMRFPGKPSRGAQVDKMLAEQDAEQVQHMNEVKEKHAQSQSKHSHHHHR